MRSTLRLQEMSHPEDSIAFKTFDQTHPLFASESRIVSDSNSIQFSTVDVHERSVHVSHCDGPKNPKQNIDVFLQPLITDLNDLWDEAIQDSQAFSVKHGRKTTWFDCHRRCIHMNHRFRKDKQYFRKNRIEHSGPPPILNGEQILDHLDQFGFKRVFDEDVE
ncbi:hypothetical protein SASPL_147233 [Salvia splendens]|uniref:Uncharacterized protein n=1 Tax=Salvia splendens TaxID=180675 RepID=A0A8X8WET7_SALSN|nr:hypothetical protein SASPL_147233 [Salvia splendens]